MHNYKETSYTDTDKRWLRIYVQFAMVILIDQVFNNYRQYIQKKQTYITKSNKVEKQNGKAEFGRKKRKAPNATNTENKMSKGDRV